MRVGVFGTGIVGKAIGTKLVVLGHEVMMGSRTADNPDAAEWVGEQGGGASQGTFGEAAAFGEVLVNATAGTASLTALESAGREALGGKVLIDVANPLDFSRGMPPTLTVVNTDSLAEQIQRAFPDARVVKALNTMNYGLMVNPSMLPGSHSVFLCGDDDGSKATVVEILRSFGWPREAIIDLGDITGARGLEMILPLWVRLMGVLGTTRFNFSVVR